MRKKQAAHILTQVVAACIKHDVAFEIDGRIGGSPSIKIWVYGKDKCKLMAKLFPRRFVFNKWTFMQLNTVCYRICVDKRRYAKR